MIDLLIKLTYSRYLDVASKIARRKMRKVRGADIAWFVCLVLLVGGCAHRRTLREIETVRARCLDMIATAPPEMVDETRAECIDQLRRIQP